MSEEILRALMQLFAIIANQDGGSSSVHANYVHKFLATQISGERIKEFEDDYKSHLRSSSEDEKPRLTSMKDSVRTLAICKKINKTLNQKQKIIVFARLIEFIQQDGKGSVLRNEILKTVGEVFNIAPTEVQNIQLLFSFSGQEMTSDFLVYNDHTDNFGEAKIVRMEGMHGNCVFLYLHNSNLTLVRYSGTAELLLNGLVIKPEQLYVFSPGSCIRHPKGTIFYSDVINKFLNEKFTSAVNLVADINEHCHPNGKKALHEIHLNESSGTLVGIMGASGSGKTTLLNILSGNEALTDGKITINGESVNHDNKQIHGVIGYIPQDDLLIEELTVFQNLYFSAQLCFKEITEHELNIKVAKMLNALGLYEVKDVVVGNPLNKKISGGQRKRLNIALELIREPQVLFVDEPTSGLSSKDSENVMDLLKELSQKGKLIFVVIHQPSSDIYKLFDKIFFLDVGGFPVYYGNPIEAVMYFKRNTNQINSDIGECHSCGSVNPELIFNLLEAREIDEYGNYTNNRKISPQGWNELFKLETANTSVEPLLQQEKLKTLHLPTRLFQWFIFLKRDLLSKIFNKQYLLINLLEVPALALLLAMLIRYRSKSSPAYSYYNNDNIPAYFFMTILVALLVGLTVSAEEIFKDQKILKREKFLKLSRLSYLLSKILILFSLSCVQSLLLCFIGNWILAVPGNFWALYFMVFSVFCAANIIGLILSSSFNSPVTIYIIIPLIIIPQMLLGGAMFRFSKINQLFGGSSHDAPILSDIMVSRWAYEGIIIDAFRNNAFEKELFPYHKMVSELNFRSSYVFPKIDELKEILVEKDSLLKPSEKMRIKTFINQLISAEFALAEKEFGTIKISKGEDSLSALKSIITNKYNLISSKTDSAEASQKKKGIDRESSTNKSIEEIVTAALDKQKIDIDTAGSQITQIIDPVYQPADERASLGLTSHMFSANKRFGPLLLSTYAYNITIIWILNLLGFLLLYSDLFKRVFSLKLKI